MSFYNLQKQAEIISINHKLNSVAEGLLKLIEEKPLEKKDRENLKWAGKLIGEINWDSEYYGKHQESSTIATTLRTEFIDYSVEDLTKFYKTFISKGTETKLSKRELNQFYIKFTLMSSKILRKSFRQPNI